MNSAYFRKQNVIELNIQKIKFYIGKKRRLYEQPPFLGYGDNVPKLLYFFIQILRIKTFSSLKQIYGF